MNRAEWGRRVEAVWRVMLEGDGQGPCAVCGEPVRQVFAWWTKNPERHSDAQPVHEGDCFQKWNEE